MNMWILNAIICVTGIDTYSVEIPVEIEIDTEIEIEIDIAIMCTMKARSLGAVL